MITDNSQKQLVMDVVPAEGDVPTFSKEADGFVPRAPSTSDPVVHYTVDPDIDFSTVSPDWEYAVAWSDDSNVVCQSLTMTEETTFNSITLATSTYHGAGVELTRSQVHIHELVEGAVGDLIVKSSAQALVKTKAADGTEMSLTEYKFPTTTLAAGTYIAIHYARVGEIAVWAKVDGTYAGGEILETDATLVTLTGWGSDPAYDLFLVMRYLP